MADLVVTPVLRPRVLAQATELFAMPMAISVAHAHVLLMIAEEVALALTHRQAQALRVRLVDPSVVEAPMVAVVLAVARLVEVTPAVAVAVAASVEEDSFNASFIMHNR